LVAGLLAALFLITALVFLTPIPGQAAKIGGGDLTFKDTKDQKPVLFSHENHVKAGAQCTDCHVKIFKLKSGEAQKTGKFTMDSMRAGQFCGTCHSGSKAFSVKDNANCNKCHKQ